MKDERPSIYLEKAYSYEIFQKEPYDMLYRLKAIKQSKKYHPEGNVWNHTLLVVDEAAKIKNKSNHPEAFMWAALLHDIGKGTTTKNKKGKITAYNHDVEGAYLAEKFLKQLVDDHLFITLVVSLIRWHMQILFVVNKLPFANLEKMVQEVNINEIAMLGLCDRLGRFDVDYEKEKADIHEFIEIANQYLKCHKSSYFEGE